MKNVDPLLSRPSPRLSILLLCDDRPDHANTVLDHIGALLRFSRHRVRSFNPTGLKQRWPIKFDEFDAVVIHYSLVCSSEYYLNREIRQQLAEYRGLKIQFIQDEYRWIDEITAAMNDMRINLLFTCIPEPEATNVYGSRIPSVERITTFTGYAPEYLADVVVTPPAERRIEIGYRAREIPYWLGAFGQEKYLIARGVLDRAGKYDLSCDISWKEKERIYGQGWIEFLKSCRATLGTGSGASIADFDGSVQRSVEQYLQFKREASFDEVARDVLEPYEGSLELDVISPRIFEAISLRTALILFPGPYSGVLREWEHYIPLAKDFSNMDEVVRHLRDDQLLAEMTDRAYRDVIAEGRYSFRAFARQFDAAVEQRAKHRIRLQTTYSVAAVKRRIRRIRESRPLSTFVSPVTARLLGPKTLNRLSRDPSGYSVKGYLALRATVRSRAKRQLVVRWLTSHRKRDRVSLDVVFEDLLKLEVLRQANESRLTAGELFRVWPRISPDGILEMRTLPIEERDVEADSGADVLNAIRAGQLHTVVWNHSALGNSVHQALTNKRWVKLWVGTEGRHELTLVRELLATDREFVLRLMTPILADRSDGTAVRNRKHKPDPLQVPVSRFRPQIPVSPVMRRFALHPLWYLARLYLAVRTIAPKRRYRQVFIQYMTNRAMRRSTTIDTVVEDLLKLDLLDRACASLNGFHIEVRGSAEAGEWSYVSCDGPRNGTPLVTPRIGNPITPYRLSWDHSAVAKSIDVSVGFGKSLKIFLGSQGVYAFKALPILDLQDPGVVSRLLPGLR